MLRRIQNEIELKEILQWRNHPDVRQVMFTDHEISLEEHLTWWSKTQDDPTREVLLFCESNQSIGVVHYYDIDRLSRACHWGFYIDNFTFREPSQRLKIWLQLEQEVIDYAFNVLDCDSLICETFEFNSSVVAIHQRFGFQETRRYKQEKNNHNEVVIEMVLIRPEKAESGIKATTSITAKAMDELDHDLSIAFLGSANWDLVAQNFIARYNQWTRQHAKVLSIPFGQYKFFLTEEQSVLRTTNLDIWVFCDRIEDFMNSPSKILTPKDFHSIEIAFNDYLNLIKTARVLTDSYFYILDLYPVCPLNASIENSAYEPSSIDAFILGLNSQLWEFCQSLSSCSLIRLSNLIQHVGILQSAPGKYWHLGKLPYGSKLIQSLIDRLIATHLNIRGKTARLIISDLDNTLWDGVIGDDGLQGIQVGGDYPGSVFSEIQTTLHGLKERGIALGICSKNAETVALEAIQEHPGMRLRLADFISIRINWKDKAQNIIEIADEVGIGLSSVLFLDDSPYEREAIRQQLPEVIVPDLPEDITQWSSFLLSYPYLNTSKLTAEDEQRVERYQIRAKIQREISTYKDKTVYWRSLEMQLSIHGFQLHYQKRVLQLLAKTNQFNTTTRRYSEIDLQRIIEQSGMILPIGLADKYSEHEIIGLIILLPSAYQPKVLIIDSFLLSCRVLGRGIESAILGWIYQKATVLGFQFLQGNFIPTERNIPAKEVYLTHGFTLTKDGNFWLDLTTQSLDFPDWLSIVEKL